MPALVEFAADLPDRKPAGEAWLHDKGSAEDRSDAVAPVASVAAEPIRVLLVGCDIAVRAHLQQRLVSSQWVMREARSGSEALELLHRGGSDLILLASRLPDLDVLEFKEHLQSRHPSIQVISLDQVLPSSNEEVVSSGLLGSDTTSASTSLPVPIVRAPPAPKVEGWQGMLGTSSSMQRVFRVAQLVARRETTVLIEGESGTGKDLLARAIHQASARSKQPFVVINCAAIPEALLEAELFGYTKGAFTGATQSRLGRVHAAHGGTLFLDEIGDMPLSLQGKILRFLEQGEVQRIGGTDLLRVDCRIIAATNVQLKEQVRNKLFREDLFYRLAVMPITLPALRERTGDLDALCTSFLKRFGPGTILHPEARRLLSQHKWPGNIRELRNVMERACLLADDRREILAEDVVL